MTMSTRIALMHAGRIEQLDTPRRMYEFPVTRYAAQFIGTVNLFNATVQRQDQDLVYLHSDELGADCVVHHGQPLVPNMNVSVVVRPEKVQLCQNNSGVNRVQGVIKEIAYLGDVSIYHAVLPSGFNIKFTQSNIQALAEQPLDWEQQVALSWSPQSCGILTQ